MLKFDQLINENRYEVFHSKVNYDFTNPWVKESGSEVLETDYLPATWKLGR